MLQVGNLYRVKSMTLHQRLGRMKDTFISSTVRAHKKHSLVVVALMELPEGEDETEAQVEAIMNQMGWFRK